MSKRRLKNRILIIMAFIILIIFMLFNSARISAYIIQESTGTNNAVIEKLTEGITNRTSVSKEEIYLETAFTGKISKTVQRYTEVFESICTALFPWSDQVDAAVGEIENRMFFTNLVFDQGYYGNLELTNECTSNLRYFLDYIEENGYDYMYVHTPGRETVEYKYDDSKTGHIISCKHAFIDAAEKKKISVLDLSDVWDMQRGYRSFDLIGHWNAADGLYASSIIAEEMNKSYAMDIDSSIFDISNYSDLLAEYPEFQNLVISNVGDDVTYPVPVLDGRYKVTITNNEEITVKEGNWRTCFINDYGSWKYDEMYYRINAVGHGGVTEIENCDLVDGPTCLIIGDSFVWPMYGYLSQSFSKITEVWSHDAKNLDLRSIIEQEQPDIILIIQNDAQFQDDYFRFKLINE